MKRSVYDLTLDLQAGHSPLTVWVKRGDTHRTLRLHLADGGKPYQPAMGVTAAFTAKKPDGAVLYNQCALEGNVVLYNLTPQTTALAGEVNCELRLYGPEDALLTSAAFLLCVEDTVYGDGDEVITSTGEATALTKLMSDAADKLAKMDRVLENELNHATIDDTKVGTAAWSSKNILDKLCPAFSVEGAVAVCDPVEGYPLEVISTIEPRESGTYESISLTRCGKNLFSGGREISFTASKTITLEKPIPAGTYFISMGSYTGSGEYQPVIIPQYADGTDMPGYLQVRYDSNGKVINPTKPITKVRIWSNGYSASSSKDVSCTLHDIQIEAGSVATPYEPYQGQTLTADFTNAPEMEDKGDYNWNTGLLHNGASSYLHNPETGAFMLLNDESEASAIIRNIPALPGTNAFYSDCGDTQVKGRADLGALLTKLLKEETDG